MHCTWDRPPQTRPPEWSWHLDGNNAADPPFANGDGADVVSRLVRRRKGRICQPPRGKQEDKAEKSEAPRLLRPHCSVQPLAAAVNWVSALPRSARVLADERSRDSWRTAPQFARDVSFLSSNVRRRRSRKSTATHAFEKSRRTPLVRETREPLLSSASPHHRDRPLRESHDSLYRRGGSS
jgi:hypothetical protein